MFRHLLAFGLAVSAPSVHADPPHVHGDDASSAVPSHQAHPVDAQVARPTGTTVAVKLADGKPTTLYVARPKEAPKGALLVFHEWWGLNDHIKATADGFARDGYLAVAVDLYDGVVAKTPDEAGKKMGALDAKHTAAIVDAALAWLAENGKGQKVATVGWCAGGGESLQASLNHPDRVVATVMYYGAPVDDVARLKGLKGPLLGIWADKDGWITPEKVKAFDGELTQAGVKHEFHAYDADHAFANPTGGKYNPPAARDADASRDRFLAAALR